MQYLFILTYRFFQPGNDPYCFVDLADHQSAAATLLAMNKRQQTVGKVKNFFEMHVLPSIPIKYSRR